MIQNKKVFKTKYIHLFSNNQSGVSFHIPGFFLKMKLHIALQILNSL